LGDGRKGSATLVVRSRGRWWLAPPGASTPAELSLQQLVDLVESSAMSGRSRRVPVEPPELPTSVTVAPHAVLTGVVVGGHLLVTGPGDAPFALDPADLQLLDSLDGPTPVADLAFPSDPVVRADRVASLVSAHVLRIVDLEDRHGDVPDERPRSDRATSDLEPAVAAAPGPDPTAAAGDRIPVYSIWHPTVGPLLSLAMLTAAARSHDGGALNERFEIRRPERAEACLADLAGRRGPAILLCSDYVFTIDDNLRTARAALELVPDLLVVHGGPSAPKYDDDAKRFLAEHGDVAHVLVRGEGERTICELLDALADPSAPLDLRLLGSVDGLSFRDPVTGATMRTPDRERITELDTLPSPFLTGEFDDIPLEEWSQPPYFETNRGCPYGCTFCDWGSATQSRIRKFDLGRVTAEFEWAAARGLVGTYICDANFGILPRDVQIAEALADIRARHGVPHFVTFTPAKNTTRHLTRILDIFRDAGIAANTSISLQTTDETTLDVVGRNNISTDAYLSLAADLRRRGHALTGDLILGLPGQSYETYRADLQFMLDHEIMPRTFSLRLLPNAPINEPSHRSQHQIMTNDRGVVASTSTLGPDDRRRAARLRHVEAIAERYGLLRHVMRQLQWDQGIPATRVMEAVLDVADRAPAEHPSIAWVIGYYDLFPAAPFGWPAFYQEVHRLVVEQLGAEDSSALRAALAVQEFLMPRPGRRFPETIELEHDYVAYFHESTRELYRSGHAVAPMHRLEEHPPGTLTVTGDPLGLCSDGLQFWGDSRDETFEGDFQIGALAANELDSPLVRLLPGIVSDRDVVARRLGAATCGVPFDDVVDDAQPEEYLDENSAVAPDVLVRLGRLRARATDT
jgi:hypothetical protein